MEIDHYEKCWCGSGKIIINCHRMGKREYGKFLSTHKNMYSSKKCYAPTKLKNNCNGIIDAHTISKSRGLSHIAKDGKVLSCMIGVDKLIKNNYKLYFIPIGISKASVFNGFCGRHDQELFSCFEKKSFIGNKEQCTTLAYRSIAREIYILENNIKNNYDQVRSNLYIHLHKAQIILSAILHSHTIVKST